MSEESTRPPVRFIADQSQRPAARWCVLSGWPVPSWYARCPLCRELVDDKTHPELAG